MYICLHVVLQYVIPLFNGLERLSEGVEESQLNDKSSPLNDIDDKSS